MSKLSIELADNGGFTVEIPSDTTEGAHHVQIPFTQTGLSVLRKLLQERAKERKATLGMNGSPTQQMVDAWLRREREERAVEERPAPTSTLLVNLNIEELDL